MKIKSELTPTIDPELSLPIIMELKVGQNIVIVLFTGETTGVVVHAGDLSGRYVGEVEDHWIPWHDELHWKVFDGKIELTN